MPPSKLFNVRLPLEHHEWVEREAEDASRRSIAGGGKRVSKSEIVKRAVESQMALGTPLLGSTGGGAGSARAVGGTVDLPEGSTALPVPQFVRLDQWLYGRSGQPKSLIRQRIKAGRVLVDGEVVVDQDAVVAPNAVGSIELDGERY